MAYYNMVVGDIHGIRPAELIKHQEAGGKIIGNILYPCSDEVVLRQMRFRRTLQWFSVLGARR